jgi:fimbrial chaperone protein
MRSLIVVFAALLGSLSAEAASLRVSPVLLDVSAPSAATTLTLRNDHTHPIDVQIRVFRWSQANGKDVLEPTADVVASPPMAALAPDTEYVVRVVRVSKRPVTAEESYRLVVDELPDPALRRAGTVTFVLRYSIPVFFAAPSGAGASVAWTARRSGNVTVVSATNSGGKRVRISNLKLEGSAGTVPVREGLVGYVLAGASMTWPLRIEHPVAGGATRLVADSESGPIRATVTLPPAR